MASDREVAGAAESGKNIASDDPDPDNAQEISPFQMDDGGTLFDLDFRGVPDESGGNPKASSVQESVTKSTYPTGLEDVSEEDLDDPANRDATKDMSQETMLDAG